MKTRSPEPDSLPELQELLHKPSAAVSLSSQKKNGTILPIQASNPDRAQPAPDSVEEPDVVSHAIGDYGRWQLLNTFLLSLFSFPCTFHIYLSTFTAKEKKFWCSVPYNLSGVPIDAWIYYSQPLNPCFVRKLPNGITLQRFLNRSAPVSKIFEECTKWDFDRSDGGTTIISEWNLVCDRSHLVTLAEVMFLVGIGIGGVVGGLVSDKFGRKKVLMSMAAVQCALALLSLLVQTYNQYVAVRLAMGLVSVSIVYAAFVLSVELVGGKWVTIAGVCNFFPLPLAYIIVSLLSMAFPDWRTLHLAVSVPGLLLLPLWWVLPESPRWLIIMNRTQETKAILEKAAKFNNRELPADLDKLLSQSKQDNTDSSKNKIGLLFKAPLRKRTFCLFLVWFSMTMVYYGIVLNIGKFNLGNLHKTSIILGVVEIPAIALSIPILLKAGRKLPIFLSMLACGLACAGNETLTVMYSKDWILILCLMVGKFAISSTNMMLPIFTAELYPCLMRNLGVGCSQISSGLALICIPYLWQLSNISEHMPMAMLAVVSVAGGAVVLLLPETSRLPKPRPSKLEESTVIGCNGTLTPVDNRGQEFP